MKHFMNWSHWLLLAALCFSTTLQAQHPPRPPHPPKPPHAGHGPQGDPMRAAFFPPEMVMHHQGDLNLSNEQRENIIKEMKAAQSNFTDWEWDLKAKMGEMKKLVEVDKVDEAKVMEHLDQILALEKKIKTQQLQLMIRVKNQLTAEQLKKLNAIKKTRGSRPGTRSDSIREPKPEKK